MAGSESTTVAARTEDAKALVQRSLDSSSEKAPQEPSPVPNDSAPLLKRSVKSELVLEQPGVVATAVKAKPAPKRELVEQSTPSPGHDEQSKAVQDSLMRNSTNDIEKSSGGTKSSGPPPNPDPPNPDAGDSSSEDSEEMRQKEEQIIKKRAVHARYMRFSRSLTSYLAKQIESIGLLAGTLQ